MARRRKGRAIDGILLLDKPYGDSSNHALQKVKRLYFAQKAGHTGALDPLATGVLPVCLGEATKFSQYLLDSDKAYRATIVLGKQTASGDLDGDVLFEKDASHIDRQQIEAILPAFRGPISQVPPMYSALKVDGQPLYKLARQGIEIERKAREVTIYNYEIEDFRAGERAEVDVYIKCSKGTYIRTLAEDLAKALGDIGGHLSCLRRVQVGEFLEEDCINLQQLEQWKADEALETMDNLLISPEVAVNHLPLVEVSDDTGYYVRRGQAVQVPKAPVSGFVRIRQENGRFLGIGEILDDGRVAPRRLINSES